MAVMEFESPQTERALGIPYFTPANYAGAALNPTDPKTPTLFRPLRIRGVELKNRIILAPMCMFSCEPDPASPAVGALTDFHVAHLGHLAMKGVALVMIEATGVQPHGRISPQDSGLWQAGSNSPQMSGLRRVVDFVHSQGAKIGIQLSHSGRKGSTVAPWLIPRTGGGRSSLKADDRAGGWPSDVVAPTGGDEYKWAPGDIQFCSPRELSVAEIDGVIRAFAHSARLAVQAGIDIIEIHAAHGYLLHQFLSPATNRRTDQYGGCFENRVRLVCEVVTAVRAAIPSETPLFMRISATEWLDTHPVAAKTGSWNLASTIRLAKLLPELGVDLLDVSSGGNHKDQQIQPHSTYQVGLAGQIRREIRACGRTTLIGAVGLIREAEAARDIVQGADESLVSAEADVVLMARQFLREPNWVVAAAKKLDVPISNPSQFGRGLL